VIFLPEKEKFGIEQQKQRFIELGECLDYKDKGSNIRVLLGSEERRKEWRSDCFLKYPVK